MRKDGNKKRPQYKYLEKGQTISAEQNILFGNIRKYMFLICTVSAKMDVNLMNLKHDLQLCKIVANTRRLLIASTVINPMPASPYNL